MQSEMEWTGCSERIVLGECAFVLQGYALPQAAALLDALTAVERQATPRRMEVPSGRSMSVAMSNCGPLGWISDRRGYRYSTVDPLSGAPWPAMPAVFLDLARSAAADCGHAGYAPDACLINHYRPGATLSLHQDRDERELTAPIVSVSLGMSAVFLRACGGGIRSPPSDSPTAMSWSGAEGTACAIMESAGFAASRIRRWAGSAST